MKRITVLFILLAQISFLFSQNLQLTWQQCFGGSEPDDATDIIEIQDGYLIVGNTMSNDGNINFNHGGSEIWVIKADSSGNFIWEKTYGGTQGEGCRRVFPAGNGNYFLLGGSNSADGDISYDPYPDTWDYWIIKVDNAGNIIWEKIVGGNGDETLWTGTTTNDGGVVAIGWSGSQDGDVTINYGLYDIWVIKLSSEGEIEWDFTLGTISQDYGQAVIQTSDGGFLVGGTSTLAGGGNLNCENHGEADGVLVKLDADRNIEWQQCYGGSDYDGIYGILELNDGYVFSAFAGSNDGDISGWHGEDDAWVVKIDFYGNILWQNCLGGSRYDYANKVYKTSDGNFVIIGITQSNDGDVTGNHSLSEYDNDIWIVKLSSEGELLSQQCIGGEGDERIDFGVVKKSDNNFVIAGQTNWGPSYDVQCTPHGGGFGEDFWVFEIKDTTTGVFNSEVDENGVRVYPNPAGDYVVFEFSPGMLINSTVISSRGAGNSAGERNPQTTTQHTNKTPAFKGDRNNRGVSQSLRSFDMTVVVVNVFGQEVARLPVKGEKTYSPSASLWRTTWDCRKVQSGIYFYKVELEGKVVCGKVVIQK